MVLVVGVPTDAAKETLMRDNCFTAAMKNLLEVYHLPKPARHDVAFDIESQETVDRESNGNWWYHYK